MPLTKSAIKALRRDKRRTEINKPIKSLYKRVVNQCYKSPSLENIKRAYSILDKTAKKGVIHKNKAGRLKSKLAKLVKLTPSAKKKSKKKAPVSHQ